MSAKDEKLERRRSREASFRRFTADPALAEKQIRDYRKLCYETDLREARRPPAAKP